MRSHHALPSLALSLCLVVPLTLASCSSDPDPAVDAGTSTDATANADATTFADAAPQADATTFPDAAEQPDAMTFPDAAGPVDSGEADAGMVAMDAMSAPDAMPSMDASVAAPDWAAVYRGVISRGCSCHINGGQAGGLSYPNARTPIADVRAALVRAANSNCGGTATNVVTPGDPTASVLYQKVAGTVCGTRMPRGGAPLAQADIDLIRDWIAGGAN